MKGGKTRICRLLPSKSGSAHCAEPLCHVSHYFSKSASPAASCGIFPGSIPDRIRNTSPYIQHRIPPFSLLFGVSRHQMPIRNTAAKTVPIPSCPMCGRRIKAPLHQKIRSHAVCWRRPPRLPSQTISTAGSVQLHICPEKIMADSLSSRQLLSRCFLCCSAYRRNLQRLKELY